MARPRRRALSAGISAAWVRLRGRGNTVDATDRPGVFRQRALFLFHYVQILCDAYPIIKMTTVTLEPTLT